jgi:non-ribosomal peptide synthetase component E (peptide arylation enzyme)
VGAGGITIDTSTRLQDLLKLERGMTNWNYGDVWELVADIQPDAIAVTQGNRHMSWRDFDRGADGIAEYLLGLGVEKQDSPPTRGGGPPAGTQWPW